MGAAARKSPSREGAPSQSPRIPFPYAPLPLDIEDHLGDFESVELKLGLLLTINVWRLSGFGERPDTPSNLGKQQILAKLKVGETAIRQAMKTLQGIGFIRDLQPWGHWWRAVIDPARLSSIPSRGPRSVKQPPKAAKVSELARLACDIRALAKNTVDSIIEIGAKLTEAKKITGHGNWAAWLEREFAWSESLALKMMQVHQRFGEGKSVTVTDFDVDIQALYLLAAPSTPDSVVEDALDRARAGERVTPAVVRKSLKSQRSVAAEGRSAAADAPPAPAAPPVNGRPSSAGPDQTHTPVRVMKEPLETPETPGERVAEMRRRIEEAFIGPPPHRIPLCPGDAASFWLQITSELGPASIEQFEAACLTEKESARIVKHGWGCLHGIAKRCAESHQEWEKAHPPRREARQAPARDPDRPGDLGEAKRMLRDPSASERMRKLAREELKVLYSEEDIALIAAGREPDAERWAAERIARLRGSMKV